MQVKNKNNETIKDIFNNYIHAGSIVYTDKWLAYVSDCNDLNLAQNKVNHLKILKTHTGVHTNTVEGY